MKLTKDEQEDFKALVLPLLDELHRLAYHLCHNQCDADDLAAEAVKKACENFRRLRDRAKIKPWLIRILSNTFISACRARKDYRAIEYVEDTDQEGEHFSLFTQISQPFLLWWGNPERELINKLLDEDIQRAIGSLPVEFRLAVVLCDVEGLSYQEISEILQVPIGTVRSRLARGRSILQKKLWHHAQESGILTRKKDDHENRKKAHQEHQL